MSAATKPIPIALPTRLIEDFDRLSNKLDISRAELMRLCMRIGLIDLQTAESDLPGIVKKIADNKLASFQAFANRHTVGAAASPASSAYSPAPRVCSSSSESSAPLSSPSPP